MFNPNDHQPHRRRRGDAGTWRHGEILKDMETRGHGELFNQSHRVTASPLHRVTASLETHEADFLKAKETESNLIQFYKGAGNILEFGAYFSTGLLMAFVLRVLSALVFYGLIVIALLVYLWIVQKNTPEPKQKEIWAIALALILSIAAAFWDALYQLIQLLLALANAFTWLGFGLFIVGLFALQVNGSKQQ